MKMKRILSQKKKKNCEKDSQSSQQSQKGNYIKKGFDTVHNSIQSQVLTPDISAFPNKNHKWQSNSEDSPNADHRKGLNTV